MYLHDVIYYNVADYDEWVGFSVLLVVLLPIVPLTDHLSLAHTNHIVSRLVKLLDKLVPIGSFHLESEGFFKFGKKRPQFNFLKGQFTIKLRDKSTFTLKLRSIWLKLIFLRKFGAKFSNKFKSYPWKQWIFILNSKLWF